MLFFLYLAVPTLQNSGNFHDSARPHLCDGLPPKSWRSVVSYRTWYALQVGPTTKNSRYGLSRSRPRADRGLSRPTSVFRTTIGVCKIFNFIQIG